MYVRHVCQCWFKLAEEQLKEGATLSASAPRSVYARSYYAMYNASKALRYITNGEVSLKGDDHKKASLLPGDLPNAASWAQKITTSYAHRLRADYENWTDTNSLQIISPEDSIATASEFIEEVRGHLNKKYGTSL